jgi:hypothetical protein
LLCVLHGGGKRCDQDGCSKSAQGSTQFCKAHGGGACGPSLVACVRWREVWLGIRMAVRSDTGQFAHAGKRCQHDDCAKSARGNTGFCGAHGGVGARCERPQCPGRALSRGVPLCMQHASATDGGRRCHAEGW